MATILAFAGSNSSTSINYQLVRYTASLLSDHELLVLNMSNYPFPMYSEDYERENGYSNSLVELRDDIKKADGLIISVNEHNGNPSAYFKNVIDWLSRLERTFIADKKIFLMATSNGKRGAIGSLKVSEELVSGRFKAQVVETFSLPSFKDNFDPTTGIQDEELAKEHQEKLKSFLAKL
ncbi:NAD(P)H-dependent oxidoreductase [Flavobacteriaceae bacterium TP-CH-4]|uniref:NAD(P)H-dependent oxidoreductase n=1 Tax=Pelagihabitans pacificus TaxID=2696054 RepID=A0A967AYA7_9FLAO|nr:NAD(P)H-dependent oxidoreductase [Pelagihabitans pacificus]NHF59817.1 NAD(P)H-dependent oxidoreductase [Pelagihabitans pacificus]